MSLILDNKMVINSLKIFSLTSTVASRYERPQWRPLQAPRAFEQQTLFASRMGQPSRWGRYGGRLYSDSTFDIGKNSFSRVMTIFLSKIMVFRVHFEPFRRDLADVQKS